MCFELRGVVHKKNRSSAKKKTMNDEDVAKQLYDEVEKGHGRTAASEPTRPRIPTDFCET